MFHYAVADTLAGKVSLSEFVDGCIHTFEKGAQAHVALQNDTPVPAKCGALDDFATKYIQKFKKAVTTHVKGLGQPNVTAAIERLSHGVAEITSRSKRQVLLEERDREFPDRAKVDTSEGPPGEKRQLQESEIADSAFWKDRQGEFANYADRLAQLHALWDVSSRVWHLWWDAAPNGAVPKEHERVFSAIARKALNRLPKSQRLDGGEPWQRWLDFMRRNDWGFKVTGNVRCTELEWDLGVKDEKPLAQIRKKQRYTTGDEDKNIYERTDTGRLRRLRPRELRGRSSEDLHKYFHWLENGRIERVFESSASFCEELASRAFELEITKSTSDGTESKAAQNKASVKPQEARVARGGRPPGVAIFGEKVQDLPPRPELRIPRVDCVLSEDFPDSAQKRFFAEQVRAIEFLEEGKSSVHSKKEADALLVNFILRLFAAFVREASKLGTSGLWTGMRFQSECLDFLEQRASEACFKLDGIIRTDVQTTIEHSTQWKRYRQLLRKIAILQSRSAESLSKLGGGDDGESSTQKQSRSESHGEEDSKIAKRSRATTVAKLIGELDVLRPQMFEDEKEYDKLRIQHPGFLAFKVADQRPDLKLKILAIRASVRHIRLAQELAAGHYGKSLWTIQDDWKDFKPEGFKRPR